MLLFRMGMEFKDKIKLYCYREVKCPQGIITGVLILVTQCFKSIIMTVY